jgi:TonB family protein
MPERHSALIIASSQYQDSVLRQLVAPAQDAEALAAVLRNPAIGGFEVETLVNETSYRVSEAIEAFLTDRDRDDLLLLYFSGHGIKDADGQLYFATCNTQHKLLRSTAIWANFVNDLMRQSRSRRQVLLLDCCHSGAFAKGMMAKSGSTNVGAGEVFEGHGRVVLTASDAIQYSFEGNDVEGQGVRSVFTHALVEGLESGRADLDSDGMVSLDELYDYLRKRIADEAPEQTPQKWAFVEGDIFIARNPRPMASELPTDIQEAVASLFASTRREAIPKLESLVRGKHRGRALAAFQALVSLREDDSRQVSSAAEHALAAYAEAQRLKEEEERAQAAEAERLAAEKAAAAEKVAREQREAQQKVEAERLARQAAEAERLAAEKAAEKVAAEKAAREQREAERKAEAERRARRAAEAERVAAEKAAAEKAAAEKAAREQREAEQRAEAERLARQAAEAKRLAAEKAATEKAAAEKAARERREAEKRAEAERLAHQAAEAKRLAAEKAATEKAAAEKAAREQREAEQRAEAERLARQRAEAERLAAEKAAVAAESVAPDQAEVELALRTESPILPWWTQRPTIVSAVISLAVIALVGAGFAYFRHSRLPEPSKPVVPAAVEVPVKAASAPPENPTVPSVVKPVEDQAAATDTSNGSSAGPSTPSDTGSTPPPSSSSSTSSSPKRVSVGGQVQAAKAIFKPSPQYPPLARTAHVQGTVRLQAVIGSDGTISKLTLIQGHPLLVSAAMDAVSRWRYRPTLLNGERAEVVTEIDVNFHLETASSGSPQPEPQPVPVAPVAAPVNAAAVYDIGPEISPPVAIYQPQAPFTPAALNARREGVVALDVIIDAQGSVIDLKQVSQPLGEGLDESAAATVRTWRFRPATRAGSAVSVRVRVNVEFRLS